MYARPAPRRRMTRSFLALLVSAIAVFVIAPAAQAAQQDISSAGPLTHIIIGDQLNCQVNHSGDSSYEFYGGVPGACGTFLLLNGTRYTPPTVPAGGSATDVPWTTVSQSSVTGTGTTANPYKVVTVVDAGTTGVRLTETDSYVVGEESYQTDLKVTNNGASAINARLWRAGDCYLQNSDYGYGQVGANGEIACAAGQAAGSRIEQWVPLTSGSHYYENWYYNVWGQIANDQAFNDSCLCSSFIDNGAGLSWDFTVPAGGSVTQSHLTNFSPTGKQPLSIDKTADSGTADAGAQDGYTATIHNPNINDVTGDFTDTLPAGFSYVAGSTTGAGEPTVNGQQLTFSNVTVPANGTHQIHFLVTVSNTPGDYYNQMDGTVNGYTVIGTGQTAKITVESAQQQGVDGRMVSNASRGGATFASIIDCPAATANAKNRPFTIKWSGKTFKLTSVSEDSCFDDPSFTPSPAPLATDFDTQTGTGAGTVNGVSGYTLTWRLEDHGAPNPNDAAALKITKDSDGSVVLNVPLGKLASGQNYAMPPA